MEQLNLNTLPGANFGHNTSITCEELVLGGNFYLEDNVQICAKRVYLGNNAKIERNTSINGLNGEMSFFSMGDETLIGFNSQILAPDFSIGDYTRIFNNALCSGYKSLRLGHNCWVGQSSILNSAETLTIGNNVRLGGNSQIWTHVASGELLEGCLFHSEQPVTIEDNVWLMGFGHSISPGVTLARNSIIMSGSVVSKSTLPFHTYSGIPAIDITHKLNGWQNTTLDTKFNLLKEFVKEFLTLYPKYSSSIFCFEDEIERLNFASLMQRQDPCLFFIKKVNSWELYKDSRHSIFDLYSKYYYKRRSQPEIDWMKFSIGYRARFIPIETSKS